MVKGGCLEKTYGSNQLGVVVLAAGRGRPEDRDDIVSDDGGGSGQEGQRGSQLETHDV